MSEPIRVRVQRVYNAAKTAWLATRPPPSGQVVRTDPRLDAFQAAITDNLKFTTLRSMLSSADSGDLARGLKLFEEMLEKDPTLDSVARTRIGKLTGLDYEIVSAAEVTDTVDSKLAEEAADFARQEFARIEGIDEGLEHLSWAIGSNLAVGELVWDDNRIVKLEGIPCRRLRSEYTEPGTVRVITGGDATGIPAIGSKWVVHVPYSAAGYPFTRSIFRAQAFVYLIKMLAIADWAVFCEIFGMPIRIAKYQRDATPEEKEELIKMMTNLGSKAFGVFSQAVMLEFVESSTRGNAPFKDLIEWCDRTQTKILLGGHLTADTTGGTGTLAAAKVHEDVRQDLVDDDIKREGQMVRQQIFAPMCLFNFWREVPLPYFRRIQPEDSGERADTAAKWQALGYPISRKWAEEVSGIPPAADEGDTLRRPDAWEEGLTEGGMGNAEG